MVAAVFVQAECIDPPAVGRCELGCQKAHPEQGFKVRLEKGLNGLLNRVRRAGEFIDLARADAEQLDLLSAG